MASAVARLPVGAALTAVLDAASAGRRLPALRNVPAMLLTSRLRAWRSDTRVAARAGWSGSKP